MSAPIDESKIRSAEQIEVDLKRTREEMAATVNELASRLDPKTLAKDAADQARDKVAGFAEVAQDKAQDAMYVASGVAADLREKAQYTVEEAKSGDKRSIAILGGAALGAALALKVLFFRKKK
ncbi:DUF3618 domain-containing protein [Arcanobacterium haemolyticum]|nr:DUF3618 domain-containing protein [Arcanobacterium haemolyticum]